MIALIPAWRIGLLTGRKAYDLHFTRVDGIWGLLSLYDTTDFLVYLLLSFGK